MLKYIARRLLVVIPTLCIVLLISFAISRSVPGDPVFREMDSRFGEGTPIAPEVREKEYAKISHQFGLDQPLFYVAMSSIAYPDTMHRILHHRDRENLSEMISIYGDWPSISAYYQSLLRAHDRIRQLHVPNDEKEQVLGAQAAIEELKLVATEKEIDYLLELVDSLQAMTPTLRDSMGQQLGAIKTSFATVQQNATPWKCYIPTVHFHGVHNQFHVWLSGLLRLDFGRSYQAPRRQVKDMILEALPVTMFMGFFSFTIAYLIAIPVGVYAVKKRGKWQDGATSVSLFMMHSIPTFVAAMLAMTFLCNPDYWQIFPTSGINSDGAEQWPFMSRMLDYAVHLTLPTLLFSYHTIAFASRQMRGSMLDTFNHDYIRTARAKGLSENTVIWRHAIRNSLLPTITQMANLFPALVTGGVVTEFIFSSPGMGLLTISALGSYDHPVILAIFTLTAIATLLGVLVADILFALADPRISFTSR